MPSNLQRHRLGVLRALLARIELVNASIGHNLTQGEENEGAVRDLLTAILPSEYGIGSGIIVGTDGERSKQVDIVVYDRTRANLTLGSNSRLFFADQVLLAIEVKTTFSSGTNSSLESALANLASVKRLKVAPQKWVESRLDPTNGNFELVSYNPSPPVGIAFFFTTAETAGPLDLGLYHETVKLAIDRTPLPEQPDLVFSLGHASFFRHTDIGNHTTASQQYSTTLVQSAGDPSQVLVLPSDLGPLKAVLDLSQMNLAPGVLDCVEVSNKKGTSKVYISGSEVLYEEPASYRVARVGQMHYLIDKARSFLIFVETIERLLKLKRPNPLWSGVDYFGSAWPLSSTYPADFKKMDETETSPVAT